MAGESDDSVDIVAEDDDSAQHASDGINDNAAGYAAFVSYRHCDRDSAVAKEVQRFLERFTVPRALREDASDSVSSQKAPAKLGSVFRDEDELPASAQLSETIQNALRNSRFLIVVCSPDTADSTWVDREIDYFVQVHGQSHVLAVLADGEPADSFPAALQSAQGSEPLAADLRSNVKGSKRRRELLRLAAAIIGCNLDNLVQRTRARRARTVAIVVAACVVAAIVVGVLAFWAITHYEQIDQENQLVRSEQLVNESRDLLAQGDRLGALRSALAALPASENDNFQSFVPSAQAALIEALGVYPKDGGAWQTCYALSGKQLGNLAAPQSGEWFALCETSACVDIYDAATGGIMCSLKPSAEVSGGFDGFMVAGGNFLACSIEGNVLALFDVTTGGLLRTQTGFYPLALSFSDDSSLLAALGIDDNNNVLLNIITPSTGNITKSYTLSASYIDNPFIVFDDQATSLLVASGSSVCVIDLLTGDMRQMQASVARVTSACICDDWFVLVGGDEIARDTTSAGASPGVTETVTRPTEAHLQAFSRDTLDVLWECNFSWETYRMPDSSEFNVDSVIWEVIEDANKVPCTLITTAGSCVNFINAFDGSLTGSYDLGSPVVGCRFLGNADTGLVFAITVEGTYSVLITHGDDVEVFTDESWSFPSQIARVSIVDAGYALYFVGTSAENLDRLYVYRCDLNMPYDGGVLVDTEFYGGATLNADGTQSAWFRADGALAVYDFTSAESLSVIDLAGIGVEVSAAENVSLSFSANDPEMLYVLDCGGNASAPHIWRINTSTGELNRTWSWGYAAVDTISQYSLDYDSCTISSERAGTFTICIPDYSYVGVIDATTFEPVVEFTPSAEVPIEDVLVLDGGVMLTRYADGTTALYDMESFEKIGNLDNFSVSSVLSLDVVSAQSHDGLILAIACADGFLRSFSCEDGSLLWEVPFAASDLYCYVGFTPDDSRLIVQDASRTVTLLDAKSGDALAATDDVDSFIVEVWYSAAGDEAFAYVADTVKASKGIYVIELAGASIQSVGTEESEQAVCEVKCVIPDGLFISGDNTNVIINFGSGIYCVPYYSLDDVIGLAELVISAGQ